MVGARPICRTNPLILASASARRRELLERVGVSLEILPTDTDEAPRPGEGVQDTAGRVAHAKAAAAHRRGRWALGADTEVVVDGAALGKPADEADALRMLRRLAGAWHEVRTAFALLGPDGAAVVEEQVATAVRFAALSEEALAAYVATGEPFGKAGAYAIQGIGAALVQELRGSYTNVVGLPVVEVLEALTRSGALESLPLAEGQAALEARHG